MSGFYAEKTFPTDDQGGTATMMTNNPKAWFLRRTEFPKPGDRLRFLGRNGYDHEREAALKVMSPGDVFTVARCEVGGWEHRILFEEFKSRWWNGVMFERVDEGDGVASGTGRSHTRRTRTGRRHHEI